MTSRWWAALLDRRRRNDLDRDLDTEISHWIAEVSARYRARGLPAAEARRRALAEMGGIDVVKERMREVRPRLVIDAALHDAGYACRSVFRSPGLFAAIVITLALGIGANAAVYSVVRTLLLQPPPYRAPHRLVLLWGNMGVAGVPRSRLAGPEVVEFQAAATKLHGLAAIQSLSAALTGDGDPEQLRIGHVTWNLFDVLGVGALRGRTFAKEDGDPSPAPPVLASWDFFQRRFGGDAAAIGRRLILNGVPVTLIGVLPEDFRLHFPADAGVPDDLQLFQPFPTDLARGHRLIRYYRVIGRLADGATMTDAAREVESIGASLARQFPDYVTAKHTFSLTPLVADSTQAVRPMLLALLGGVLIVLVAACVNVAGLLLARAAARRREVATLVALGADRRRLARQFAVEGLLIAAVGAAAGLGTGALALRALVALRPAGLDRLQHATIDAQVLIAVAAVSCAWGLLFALAPMTEFARFSAATALQTLSPSSGRMRTRTRSTLVIAQIALSTVLVVTAGLLVRTMQALQEVETGFDLDASALTFRLALPAARYPTGAEVNAFSRELELRLRAVPGVQHVGAISQLPFDDGNLASKYFTETSERNLALARAADTRYVSPGALPALGLRLVAGRWFTEADDRRSTPSVVVDERLARLAWPDGRAIGQRLHLPLLIDRRVTTMWTTVIGIVRHVRHRTLDADGQEQVYLTYRQNLRDPMAYVVRASSDPALVAAAVRSTVSGLDGLLPAYDIAPLQSRVERATSGRRFTALLIASFAFLALALAAVGLAGLVSYSVASRLREFGIRLALGSTPGGLRVRVLREAFVLVGGGLVLGIASAAAAAAAMRSLLFGVGPADAISYGGAILLLSAIALAATWSQARRASAVNPADALRAE
jgi:putative ABC transport system permease protein